MAEEYIDHPLVREINRQIDQGFLEEKQGWISPSYGFLIKHGSGKAPGYSEDKFDVSNVLKLTHAGVQYRGSDKSASRGSNFSSFKTEDYQPFRTLIHAITEEIGRGGEATFMKQRTENNYLDDYCDEGRNWEWINKKAKTLGEAINNYRYGSFKYRSSDIKVQFDSYEESEVRGDIIVYFRFNTLEDLDPAKIAAVSDVLQNWTYEEPKEVEAITN